MNKVRFIIPKLLSFLSLPLRKWEERWDRIMSELEVEIKKEAGRGIQRRCRPNCTMCTSNNWSRGGWNSGIYCEGAIRRDGWRCYNCGYMIWDKTDEQFITDIEEHSPHVLLACTNIRDEYLPFISTELLEERVVRKANDKANALIRERDHVIKRLVELEELESQGAMKIKAA